ncbi:hypothetical protein HY374_02265 [Candidatus Berkelbacteria bacterium]|nr:hypothetical protein [Candidatus Berkelbacteria bacterium]
MRLSPQERAILTPLVFFSLFDRPVLKTSLHQLAYRCSLTGRQVEGTIERLEGKGRIVTRHGYVALTRCERNVPLAQARDRLSDELWQDARRVIANLAAVPFVKLIAVVNSLAFHNAHAGSDVDLLVVTEPGRLAIARDHLNAHLTLWRRRNTHGDKRGKLSVDVWMDASDLSLGSFRLRPRDIYFEYWTAWIASVLNRDQTYEQLLAANPWLHRVFPQHKPHTVHQVTPDPVLERRRAAWEAFYRSSLGQRLGAWQAEWQHERLARFEERVRTKGTVLISPRRLRFHVPDRRPEYQAAFEARWQEQTA